MNKTAKIILSLLLVICMCLVCGCSGDDTADTSSSTSVASSADVVSSVASGTASNTSSTPSMSEEQIMALEYLSGSWQNQIDTVDQKSEGKFVFGVQTDTHHHDMTDETLARNLAAMSYFVDFKFVSNLGDLVRGYSVIDVDSPENMRACMDDLVTRYTMAKCPVLMTFGNHDANHMWSNKHTPGDHTTLITELEHYSRVIAPLKEHNGDAMVTNGESTYYYMDFPEDNIRVVMLNTTDGKFTESFSSTFIISNEQLEWFKSEALDTDKYVIVMSHVPLYWVSEENPGNTVTNGDAVLQAVEDFAANGGHFVGYFHGHMHERSLNVDQNGRFHMGFLNGGNPGEAVIVDIENKLVETVILGNGQTREIRFF